MLATDGRSSGLCVDPIENKPRNHFYPGSAVLSFGTAGCNLACKFCQHWDISKSREQHTLTVSAAAAAIAAAAVEHSCGSVAFTYNGPIIFHEYALDSVWVRDHLGIEVPRHISAFHPDWKMRDIPATPLATLSRARNIALAVGLHHVYTGNVHRVVGDASHCRACGLLLVQRDCYEFQHYALTSAGRCRCCCEPCAGHFADVVGHWGRPRMAIKLA